MKILILEDDDNRIKKFKENFIGCELFITPLPSQANKWLETEEFDFIFLDCDLSEEHYNNEDWTKENYDRFGLDSGICTARFLGENTNLSKNATIIIHSLNPVGSLKMEDLCKLRNPKRIPYYKLFGYLIIV